MKAGAVATIRINPRDAQSVLDVLDAAGVPRKALSFAQCVSLALGSLLETARHTKLIPEPDEFEYLNRLAPYLGPAKRKRKAKIADALHDMGGSLRAPALSEAPVQARTARWDPSAGVPPAVPQAPPRPAVQDPAELERSSNRLTELLQLKDDDEEWTDALEQEFQHHYKVVYPDG